MMIGQANEADRPKVLFSFHRLLSFVNLKRQRIHNFTHQESGVEYVFDAIDEQAIKGYMTAQGRGVKPNDIIVMIQNSHPQRYRVETIEYYASPADMWVALLTREDV